MKKLILRPRKFSLYSINKKYEVNSRENLWQELK